MGESVQDPGNYYRNNLINSVNLLDVMRSFGVKYFVFSSSCAVDGIRRDPIDENEQKKPISPYRRAKFMVEEILRDYDQAYGIKHVSLRYFNAAGADPEGQIGESHNPETHLIPLVIKACLGVSDSVKVFGVRLSDERRHVHKRLYPRFGFRRSYIRALEYVTRENVSNYFNLGNGSGYSVREVVDAVRRIGKREFKVIEVGRETAILLY